MNAIEKVENLTKASFELLLSLPRLLRVEFNAFEEEPILEIHTATEPFFHLFRNAQIKIRENDDPDYPYRAYIDGDGYLIFTLLTQEDYEKHVLKEVI